MSSTPLFEFPHFTKSCFDTHCGLWCIDDGWSNQFLMLLQSGLIQQHLQANGPIAPVQAESPRGYDLFGDTAVVPLVGSLSPRGSKFGGGSTLEFRRGLRAASRDPQVGSILAYINSPGGVVEGTYEAARDMRRAGDSKPTRAHIQDMGASAAYWIASQAHTLSANNPAFVGNIGVRAAILDTSKAFELNGLRTRLFATGPFKAIGVPGVEVTDEQVQHFQSLVNDTFKLFTADVREGRGLSGDALDAVLTGKTYLAEEAQTAGLIDEVADIETLMPSGETSMAAEQEHSSMSALKDFLTWGKLKVVPADEPNVVGELIPGHAVSTLQPIKTFEQGVQEGVDAMRAEAIEILQLCTLGDPKQAVIAATAALQGHKRPAQVREELAAERVLSSMRDDEGKEIPDVDTAHVRPVPKATTKLSSAYEMAAKRDQMAVNGNGRGEQ